MVAGLRPPSWIFLKNFKLQVVALVGLKWPTIFQKGRSNGLKVIAITETEDGLRPPTWIFLKILKLQVVALVG
jgi:hypothetical protein